jgi:hypothetical protein
MGEPYLPVVLWGGKNKPVNTVELYRQIREFQKNEKSVTGQGWEIEWDEWKSNKFGKQKWPSRITVPTEADFLFLIDKEKEVIQFKNSLLQLLTWNEGIRKWLLIRPLAVLELQQAWKGICAVTQYLMDHDVRQFYIRCLPVPVHSKFIQQHQTTIFSLLKFLQPDRFNGELTNLEETLLLKRKPFLFTMRCLDMVLARQYTCSMEVIGVTAESLAMVDWDVQKIILVENETNLYLLPPLQGTIALCSFGKALFLLKNIPLFQRVSLFYWGDLDEEGFMMLSNIRKLYPLTQSLLMDQFTVSFHKAEMTDQPSVYKHKIMDNLRSEELEAFEMLALSNGRIEQERLQQEYVANILKINLE